MARGNVMLIHIWYHMAENQTNRIAPQRQYDRSSQVRQTTRRRDKSPGETPSRCPTGGTRSHSIRLPEGGSDHCPVGGKSSHSEDQMSGGKTVPRGGRSQTKQNAGWARRNVSLWPERIKQIKTPAGWYRGAAPWAVQSSRSEYQTEPMLIFEDRNLSPAFMSGRQACLSQAACGKPTC